jgi:putative nicotinate phosphoribosyltransferase
MFEHSGLLTDLYELTMAAGYLQTRFEARATFELFVRHLPPHRNYLVAAGLEQALDFLENVHFSAEEIDYLRQHPVFRNIRGEFFDYLAKFRFTGDVWAMPEGSLVFPGEPMLRVVAPIIEGQIMETYFLSTLSYQTMIASKQRASSPPRKAVRSSSSAPAAPMAAKPVCSPRAPEPSAAAKALPMCWPASNSAWKPTARKRIPG